MFGKKLITEQEEIKRIREIMGLSILNEQNVIPADTLNNMKYNIGRDFYSTYEVLDYCSFLEYWKTKYDNNYDTHTDEYSTEVQTALRKYATAQLPVEILSTLVWLESRGESKPTGNKRCFGLWQFCRKYFVNYGIKDKTEAENPDIATRQAVKHLTRLGRRIEEETGINVFTPDNQYILYLAWQQGRAGITKIVNGCDKEFTVDDIEIPLPSKVEDILQLKDVVEKNDQGNLVEYIQSILIKKHGIDLGRYGKNRDGIDGIFGSKTKRGVKTFQKKLNLAIDGIVGFCTMTALSSDEVDYCCQAGKCKENKCKDKVNCKNSHIKKEKITKDLESSNNIKVDKKLPRKFELIPGGQRNYRTNQPTLGQLKYILQDKYPDIQRVVRMNAEESTGVTIKAERNLVESLGKEFFWVNAHKGFKEGEGYLRSMDEVIPLLEEGDTLIHCTAGKDRTGFMVARYLKDIGYNNWTDEQLWEYTVKFNSWERKGYICNNLVGYVKYLQGFYSMENWCNAKEERKRCKVCTSHESGHHALIHSPDSSSEFSRGVYS